MLNTGEKPLFKAAPLMTPIHNMAVMVSNRGMGAGVEVLAPVMHPTLRTSPLTNTGVQMSWAKQEFETIELGDARLNQRAVLLAERLGQKPGASIPGACENWAETAAAYRFLRNEQVGWEEVLSAHAQASQARIREHAVVLCIQDTTELDYNGQAMSGLGPLSFEASAGSTCTPPTSSAPSANRWVSPTPGPGRGVQAGRRTARRHSRACAGSRATSASPNRPAPCPRPDTSASATGSRTCCHCWSRRATWITRPIIWCAASTTGCSPRATSCGSGHGRGALGCVRFELPAGRGRKARPVEQALRAERVELADRQGGKLEVTCLIATEINAPPAQARVLAPPHQPGRPHAGGGGRAARLVSGPVGKSSCFPGAQGGCRVERLQLADTDRLQTALALYMVIIAWRINRLMRLGAPCRIYPPTWCSRPTSGAPPSFSTRSPSRKRCHPEHRAAPDRPARSVSAAATGSPILLPPPSPPARPQWGSDRFAAAQRRRSSGSPTSIQRTIRPESSQGHRAGSSSVEMPRLELQAFIGVEGKGVHADHHPLVGLGRMPGQGSHVRQSTTGRVSLVHGLGRCPGFEGHGSDGTQNKNQARRRGFRQYWKGFRDQPSPCRRLARGIRYRQQTPWLPWRPGFLGGPRRPGAASACASTASLPASLVASRLPARSAMPTPVITASAACLAASSAFWAASLAASTTGARRRSGLSGSSVLGTGSETNGNQGWRAEGVIHRSPAGCKTVFWRTGSVREAYACHPNASQDGHKMVGIKKPHPCSLRSPLKKIPARQSSLGGDFQVYAARAPRPGCGTRRCGVDFDLVADFHEGRDGQLEAARCDAGGLQDLAGGVALDGGFGVFDFADDGGGRSTEIALPL